MPATTGSRTRTGSAGRVASLALLALFVASCANRSTAGSSGQLQSQYEFTEIRILAAESGTDAATIGFHLAWSTDVFPGVHECTWKALDQSGQTIGVLVDRLIAMSEGNKEITLDVTGLPTAAEITCDPARLDVGEPYAYEFTDVEIRASELVASFEFAYHVRWLGGSIPGPVTCTLRVFGQGDDVLLEERVNILASSGEADQSRPLFLPEDGVPTRAAFEGCRPFA